MQLTTFGGDATAFSGGLLVVGRHADAEPTGAEQAIDEALGGALSAAAARLNFKGKPRQQVGVDTLGRIGAARVLLVGLGKAAEAGAAGRRDYAAIAVAAAMTARYESVCIVPADDDIRDLACGAVLGSYRFDDLKADDEEDPRFDVASVAIASEDAGAIESGGALGEAVNLARTLVNLPANICTPEYLAATACSIADSNDRFEVTVFGWDEIRARKMGGIEGVSQGASRPPRFIHMKYTPPGGKDEDALAFVGKGLTFDSGGLSLKPAKSMADMYIDMAGAAAVIGAMKAVAALNPSVPVHGIVGACENMPGGNSYRPSDVLTMYSGKTVEVLNTDAEGRLVLADAIHYATLLEPRGIIDLATLTGACMVALGPFYSALFSDDEPLAAEITAAAKRSDERFWRLPLDPKLADTLKSKRADITNLGGPWGGAITAAQFLQNFKGDVSWAHLDIAGPALAEKDDASIRVGGTGFGVLTLWALLEGATA